MNPSFIANFSAQKRMLLLFVASILFFSFTPDSWAAASTDLLGANSAQTDLSMSNAYAEARQAGGMNVLFAVFAVFFAGCLMTSLGLGAAGVLAFQRTHEWAKLQNNLVGIGFFFGLAGIFFYLMAKQGMSNPFGS